MAKPKKPTRLTNIALREVSFVDRPANPHAQVILAKRKEDEAEDLGKSGPTVGDVHQAGVSMTKCPKGGCDKAMYDGKCPDHGKVGKSLFTKALELFGIKPGEDVEEDLTKLNEAVLSFEKDSSDDDDDEDDTDAGSSGDDDTDTEKNMSDKNEVLKGLSPEARAEIEKQRNEAVEKAKADARAEVEKEVAAKAAVEKTAIEKQAVEIEKANIEIKKLRDEADSQNRLTVAKGLVSKSGLPADAVSNILKQLDEEGTKQFKDILSKTETFAEGSKAFTELGKSHELTGAAATIDVKVAELRKSDTKLTKEQAVAKVLEENPDLYAASLAKN